MSVYDEATRARLMEKMVGRSVFSIFCNDVMAKGNLAVQELNEIKVSLSENQDGQEPTEN